MVNIEDASSWRPLARAMMSTDTTIIERQIIVPRVYKNHLQHTLSSSWKPRGPTSPLKAPPFSVVLEAPPAGVTVEAPIVWRHPERPYRPYLGRINVDSLLH